MKVIVGVLLILSISIQPGWAEESDAEFDRNMGVMARLIPGVGGHIQQAIADAEEKKEDERLQQQQVEREEERQAKLQAKKGLRAEKTVQQDSEVKAQLQRDIASGKVLKVKGFYLRMPIDEATELLNEQLGTNYNVAEHNYDELGFIVMGTYYQHGIPVAKYPMFGADKSGKVIMITFGGDLLDALFNVEGIPMEDFAQTFVNSYPIPTMEPFYENGMSGWQYVSPYGWKVQIDAQRALMMKTVPSKKEMKFD